MGPSWGSLGPSWSPLEGPVGRLGAISGAFWADLDAEYVRSASFSKGMGRFVPLGGRLRGLWGHLGSFLGHIEVMSATLGAVLCCLGAPWDLSDNPSDRLEGPGDRFEGRPEGPKAPDPGSPVFGGGGGRVFPPPGVGKI